MSMTRATRSENRFGLWTNWTGYLKMLDAVVDTRVRVTYDRGRLELMSPSMEHEKLKKIIACLLEAVMFDQRLKFVPGGSMTFKRQDLDRGLEPDECYWIANHSLMTNREEYDASTDPPPDLALEVEVTRSTIDRMAIYRVLCVPEIWRWTKRGRMEFHVRTEDGQYVVRPISSSFRWLSSDELAAFARMGRKDLDEAVFAFRNHARDVNQ